MAGLWTPRRMVSHDLRERSVSVSGTMPRLLYWCGVHGLYWSNVYLPRCPSCPLVGMDVRERSLSMSNTGDGATLYDTTRKPGAAERLRALGVTLAPLLADLLDEAKRHVDDIDPPCQECADLLARAEEEIA